MKLLVVIDMQNDFITGSLGSEAAQKIVPVVKEKIAGHNGPVIYTKDTHFDDYLSTAEGKKLPVPHCIHKTEGWEIEDSIKPADPNAVIVHKPSFGFTLWKETIEEKFGVPNEIEVCGLCTDICVVSNVLILKAIYPEAKITVDAKATAGVSEETYKAALLTMKTCQIDVVNEEE